MADAEEEVEENRFRLGFLTGSPRDPTVTKASVSSPGSGTVRGLTWSAGTGGELGESLEWSSAGASDCVLVDSPVPGMSVDEREVRRREAATPPLAVTRDRPEPDREQGKWNAQAV